MFSNLIRNRNAFLTAINSLHQTSFRCLNYIPIQAQTQITVGHKMTQTIDKNRQKALMNEFKRKQLKARNKNSDHLLISCSTPSFNHYHGQVYKKFTPLNLASVGWLARQSSGKYFTINALGKHPSLTDESCSFTHLNISQTLIDSLKNNMKIERPTNIQYMATNEVLNRNSHSLIVAETGGGKTLTYLLSVIETCTRMHRLINDSGLSRLNNQPLAVIVVPTRELVFQIYTSLFKLLGPDSSVNFVCDVHPDVINAKRSLSSIPIASMDDKEQKSPVDILITLPTNLKKRLSSSEEISLNSVYLKNIVFDEADTLMDDSNNQMVLDCLKLLKLNLILPKSKMTASGEAESGEDRAEFLAAFNADLETRLRDPSTHLSFVSATTPRDMKNILENLIDYDQANFQVLKTKNTSKLMLHVPQKFLRLSTEKRNAHLLELVGKELANKNQKRTIMIFSHRTATAVFASKFLKENGIECELLTKKMNTTDRESLVERFFNGQVRVICCTDIASRGWDTLHVNHVINFEMPLFITDYIHRIGRVGRLNCNKSGGGAGMVTNYVTKPYEIDLVWNIERSVRLDIDLHNVNANVKRVYNTKYEPKIGEGSGKRSYPSKKSDLTEASLDDEEIDRLALAKLKPEDSFENWSQLREL